MKTEDHLTDHMPRREAEERLAARAQTKQHHDSAFEEAERLRMFNQCVNGKCSITPKDPRRFERVVVTLGGKEIEV